MVLPSDDEGCVYFHDVFYAAMKKAYAEDVYVAKDENNTEILDYLRCEERKIKHKIKKTIKLVHSIAKSY